MASHETIYVTEGAGGSLLSWRTSQKLDLISIITPLTINNKTKVEQLVHEYSDLFSGLGKLKNYQVKLYIDETVQTLA